jgi:hypothetical protein
MESGLVLELTPPKVITWMPSKSTNQIATAAVVVVYLEIAHPVGNDEALNQ